MKNSLLILILTLVFLLALVGCQPSGNDNQMNGIHGENQSVQQESENEIPENDAETDENESDIPKTDDKNSDNEGESPKNNDENNTPEEGENNTPENGENNTPSEDGNNNEEGSSEETPSEPLPEIGTDVGKRFKDLTLATMDGGSINTADLRGKIVIVNVWASWCPPCKAELPDFDRIAKEYKDRVVIIAADIDAGYGGADAYVQQNFPETDIIFAYDTVHGDAYYAAGGEKYVPQTAILDQNGVIVYSDSGALTYEWLVNMINQLLK